jgi:hypothetical protein
MPSTCSHNKWRWTISILDNHFMTSWRLRCIARVVKWKLHGTCHLSNCKIKFMIPSTFIVTFPYKVCSILRISSHVWMIWCSNLFSINCNSYLTPWMILFSIDLISIIVVNVMMFQVVWNFGWILTKWALWFNIQSFIVILENICCILHWHVINMKVVNIHFHILEVSRMFFYHL